MPPTSEWLAAAPLVIAHRGASVVAPENTMAAFEAAVRLGAEAIELDAKLSRDDQVVCFHDRTLARTTGAKGAPGGLLLQELRALDAGAWKDESFRGARIPTLAEVLESVGGRALVNIELTDYWSDQPRLVAAAVADVRRHGLGRRVLFSSFQSRALVAAEALAPDIPRAHLIGPTPLAYRDRFALRRASLHAFHLHVSLAGSRRITSIHDSGRRVHIYTVDEPEEMRRLWGEGVDGIFTDLPDQARRARESP
jgi:glycerophosphoryl diester phosphodiesterase